MSRENNPNATIRHFVGLKLKASATQEQKDDLARQLSTIPELVPFVFNFHQGPVVSPRYHSADCDYAICCDIPGYAAMDCYMSHPGHLESCVTNCIAGWYSYNWEVTPVGRQDRPSDEEIAAEIAKEQARKTPVHSDPNMAYVPDFRGQPLETALAMLEKAGLKGEVAEKVKFSSWAPGRVVDYTPARFSEMTKGSIVKLTICDDYLMATDAPLIPDDEVKLC